MLSGGERRRLQLLTVLTQRPNFLILDEPTNDLDVDTLTALEQYLIEDFKGVLLLVSHDRYFTDKVTDHLFVLEGNGIIKDYQGSLSDYSEAMEEMDAVVQGAGSTQSTIAGTSILSPKEEKELRVARRNALQKSKREFNSLEPAIEKLKASAVKIQAEIESKSNEGWSVLAELTDKLNALENEIEEKEMRWMELAEILEQEESL